MTPCAAWGYRVRPVQRLKIDDGCCELRATDAQGWRIKTKVDPETLQIIQVKHKDRHCKHDRSDTAPSP